MDTYEQLVRDLTDLAYAPGRTNHAAVIAISIMANRNTMAKEERVFFALNGIRTSMNHSFVDSRDSKFDIEEFAMVENVFHILTLAYIKIQTI